MEAARAAARARHRPLVASATRRRAIVPARRRAPPRRRDPERGRARGDPRRPGRARRRATRCSRSRTRSAPAIAKALLGRAVVPDDVPFVTGSIGLLGTRPSYELMTGCDTLLMVGSSFPYSEFLPEEGKARGVQIDIDARLIGIRYPMEVQLVGDARETLRALHAAARAQGRPRLAGADRRPGRGLVGADGCPRARRRRPDQPAARLLGALARGCPTTASSPPTRARRRTGSPATCGCAAG